MRQLLETVWAGIEGSSLCWEGLADETIRPQALGRTGDHRARVLTRLLSGGSNDPTSAGLTVGELLGQGGMGVVRRGVQSSLDREVAVKAVRPDKISDETTVKLLQEAWIAGTLQHPNIVPVYDIAVGGEGQPMIVQQRIEGTAWSELLRDEDLVRDAFGVSDPFEWHLRVLCQVCNAVSYAHSQGIVHLDIKPSNVMVGAFGEVFLLDWGLAMSLSDDRNGRLPLVADVDEVLGTPAFMAPEMLTQGEERLSELTDVYLLGSTLYRICAGRPPHLGNTPIATMFAAATREPEPLKDVPTELAKLCSYCMSTELTDRPPTVAVVRQALQAFLEHRAAVRLAEETTSKLCRLEELCSESEKGTLDGVCPNTDVIRGLCSEVRFGFQHATAMWCDEPLASAGLARLRLGMARWELSEGRPQAAFLLLEELDSPPAELRARVLQALEELKGLEARVEELQAFADQQDLSVGMRTRIFIVAVLGLCFSAIPLYRAVGDPQSQVSSALMIASPLAFFTIFTGLVVWGRESMMRSSVNRRTVGTMYVLIFAQAALAQATKSVGLGLEEVLPVFMVFWSVVAALYAMHVDRAFWVTSVGYAVAAAATLQFPLMRWWFATSANTIFILNAILAWNQNSLFKRSSSTQTTDRTEPADAPDGG